MEFQHSGGRYGQYIREYEITVCTPCYTSNWDGWNMTNTRKIIEHLKANGLPVPETNDKGFLPRG
ncbi:MAG: hypothetical protein GY756_10825 [bacterium]|nr:hypothetical protein [bacterium]